MSNLIVSALCANYEDYDKYGEVSCTLKHWPDMWPEEKYAEGALWREHHLLRERNEVLWRYSRLSLYRSDEDATHDCSPVVVRALVSIARENSWKVANADLVKCYGMHAVYTIPPEKENEAMPTRWRDIVRWMDRERTKQEQQDEESARRKAHQEAKRKRDNRIEIDYVALIAYMGDLLPDIEIIKSRKSPVSGNAEDRLQVQEVACAMLAEENGWERNDPRGFSGNVPRIYKTA